MSTTSSLLRRRFALMAAEHTALVGARIREAREGAHLTQNELADRLPGKADGTQVSKWERGVHRPGDDTLRQIAGIVGRDLGWFHTRPADKTATPDLSTGQSQLDRIEQRLDQIISLLQGQPDVGLMIHDEFQGMAARLERASSKRPPRSQRATGPQRPNRSAA